MGKLKNEFQELSHRVSVILVNPMYAGNIGSVARSMNNLGFDDLRIVAPRTEIGLEARKMAMHSEEIIQKAGLFDTLTDAMKDIDMGIATTRRRGRRRGTYFSLPAMAEAARGLSPEKKIAIVFGPEDSGLSNEDLDLCKWLVTINTFSDFNSFNLSHAVTIVLYELSRSFAEAPEKRNEKKNDQLDGLLDRYEYLMRKTGFLPPEKDPRRVMLTLRRMLTSAGWSRSEIKLFHSILNSMEREMEK